MRRNIALVVLAWLLVSPQGGGAPVDRVETLVHKGLQRRFHLHVPAAARGPMPLVVVLHGGGGSADPVAQIKRASRFDDKADAEGFAVLYPQALEGNWNDGRGLSRYRSQAQNIDDVGFIAAAIDRAAGLASIDRDRVYATGASNGGMMTYRLACEDAARYAAAAAVIANLPVKLPCRPARGIPVAIINGTEDPLMPWAGGSVRFGRQQMGDVISAEATAARFASINGCAPTPVAQPMPDRAPRDGTRAVRLSFARCAAEVVLYRIDGGGHTWPGPGRQTAISGIVGRTSRDIDATAEIWEFFARAARR